SALSPSAAPAPDIEAVFFLESKARPATGPIRKPVRNLAWKTEDSSRTDAWAAGEPGCAPADLHQVERGGEGRGGAAKEGRARRRRPNLP
ncbi:hypothetical protein, partial [Escherichia coli]|uniref:hypothetical protein n=1 Tax=Escherichia coli TaxID=562 RepID=UPI0028E00EBE